MADLKISQLNSIVTVVPATDVLPVVQGGTTLKITPNQILGAGGTATLASATITGALTVDTTTLVANAAGYTDKVGVGTATPAATLHVKGSGRVDGDYNLFDFYKDNGSTRLGYLLFRDDGPNYFNVNSNQPLYLTTNNTAQVQVETSGDVKINTGNVVMATSGKGIDFSATASGSGTMTSELLNDYEEGTFTATLKGSTTDPTIAVTTTGKYTKIGNQVFVRIMFGNVSTLGASGAISITGLPFTSASAPEQIGYLMVENMATFTNSSLSSYLAASSSTLNLYTSTSNSIITQITHNAGVARYLWTAITYTV